MTMKVLSVLIPGVIALVGLSALAADPTAEEAAASGAKVKYKAGKDVNFEELLIKGELNRPEITVVTGQVDKGTDGLLKLRENFLDRVASDQGEEAP
ncbi:MAG: hypothetical protein JST04_09850 [Bdellovibrionales bacterium]|nr:hypothetical protein [Bdellovibrionales bacterium]